MKANYTFLCPVDFSPSSDNMVEAAAHIASLANGSITLLHVYRPGVSVLDIPADVNTLEIAMSKEVVESNLKYLQDKVKSVNSNIEVDFQVREGVPSEQIVEYANHRHYDLVIMGTKGPTALELFVFGSETIHVMNELHCPLLVIPEKYRYKKPERIVYASDFMEKDIEAIQWLIDFSRSCKPECVILNVTSEEDPEYHFFDMFRSLVRKAVKYPKLMVHQTRGEELRESIAMYTKANGADWLAMMSRKREGLEKLFGKSLSEDIVRHSDIPVLIFHHPGIYNDLYGDWILRKRIVESEI